MIVSINEIRCYNELKKTCKKVMHQSTENRLKPLIKIKGSIFFEIQTFFTKIYQIYILRPLRIHEPLPVIGTF